MTKSASSTSPAHTASPTPSIHSNSSSASSPLASGNFLQSPLWAETNRLQGIKTQTFTSTSPRYYCLAILRNAKRGRYYEIPAGPLINWSDSAAVSHLFSNLAATAKSDHCVFIRFRPQLPDTEENHALLTSTLTPVYDLRPAKMHLAAQNTVILDLTQPEDDLLMSFRRQTRYEVRQSEKQGIIVREETGANALKSFHALQVETAERQGFIPPSLKELEAERDAFKDYFHLFSAYLPAPASETNDKTNDFLLCSGLFLSDDKSQEAAYYEAASTPAARKHPGAPALIWHAIRFFKAAGYTRLNLWGIAPPGVTNHRYSGVTTFKTGFGGDIVNYLPAQDIVLDKLRYTLTDIIETSRKKKRNL